MIAPEKPATDGVDSPAADPAGAGVEHSAGLRTLIRQSAIYFVGRILPAFIGIGGIAVYTRLIAPAAMGEYALLTALALIGGVGFNWLRVAVFRAMGGSDDLGGDFARTVLALFGASAAAVAILESAGLLLFYHGLPLVMIGLTIGMTVSNAWFELECVVLQSQQRVGLYGIVNLARAVFTLAASVAAIRLGFGAAALLAGYVTGSAASLAFGRLWWVHGTGRFDRGLAWSLFHFGWPSSASAILSQLSGNADRFFLTSFAGTAALGIYAVSANLSRQTVFLLIVASALAGQPMAMRLLDRCSAAAAQRQLRLNARAMGAIAIPAVAGLAVLSGPISEMFLGPAYRNGAGPVMSLIAVSGALFGMRTFYFDQAFELARNTRPQALISAIVVAVAVAGNALLVPRAGALGAAAASVLAATSAVALSIGLGRQVFRVPLPWLDWLKTLVAAAAMSAVVALIPKRSGALDLAADVALGAVIYGIALALLVYPNRVGAAVRSLRRRRITVQWLLGNSRAVLAAWMTKATWRLRPRRGRAHGLPGILIVSLTSYRPRFGTIASTLRCLLSQSVKPDAVILWVGYGDVPHLPAEVRAFAAQGLEIRATEDLGPHTKLVPALAAYPDAFIATADDDVRYGRRWLEDLVGGYAGDPREIVCHRAHRVRLDEAGRPLPYGDWEHEIAACDPSPLVMPTGVGGVLYPPHVFPAGTLDAAAFRATAPTNDDLWFYWCGRRNGAVYKKIGARRPVVAWTGSQGVSLYAINVVKNDRQIEALMAMYGFPADRRHGSGGD